jgi:2-succinyl-5-enolpyruvyl-6-hydroxy-3-cyclohexene-1-carboxylate synthase
MKKKVNRNVFWAETFVNEIAELGVKYACISPGSRNTVLTLAFSNNKKIKSFVIIDERSSAFFGLGLAKESNSPVVLVSTSGTATAEFYPAIIEAYYYHVPLIVCTADRPPELLNCGANQTINQDNIYKNHINWYFNVGLPELTNKRIKNLKSIVRKAYFEFLIKQKGPVHLNFPFRKPFEPFSYTDEINENFIHQINEKRKLKDYSNLSPFKMSFSPKDLNELFRVLRNVKKGLIIAGPDDPHSGFPQLSQEFAYILKYPVIADGISQLRSGNHKTNNIIVNFEGLFRSEKFINKYMPELIIQFGKTPTSKGLEIFFENSSALKYLINESGDWYDPSNKAAAVIEMNPAEFCKLMIKKFQREKFININSEWLNSYLKAERLSSIIKSKLIDSAIFPFEGRIIPETINLMPDDSLLMVSNSMPARDLDYFAPKVNKSISIFNNRGASGIDGITSTALGIAQNLIKPTVLITGDLAFYYDLNGLLTSKKYKIPLVIILINNNGGGIFEMLPIAKSRKTFTEYFLTPHNINFSPIVKTYGGKFIEIISWKHFRNAFQKAIKSRNLSVLQIKTDAKKSKELREKYWHTVDSELLKI